MSTANPELTEDVLLEILLDAQNRNASNSITGLLLHSDGNIIQVIEGREDKVNSLYKNIANNSLHRGVTLIVSEPIKKRDFPEFRMGFRRVRSRNLELQLPGFTEIVEQRNISDRQLAGLSKKVSIFIRTFAKSTKINGIGSFKYFTGA
jgi:hypothetical protein